MVICVSQNGEVNNDNNNKDEIGTESEVRKRRNSSFQILAIPFFRIFNHFQHSLIPQLDTASCRVFDQVVESYVVVLYYWDETWWLSSEWNIDCSEKIETMGNQTIE